MIPEYLYRGDADSRCERQLVATWGKAGLLTNMSQGGNGKALLATPFVQAINQHVFTGWTKTHFLSFSEDINIARGFAVGRSGKRIQAPISNFWQAAVLTLSKSNMTSISPVGSPVIPGVWHCKYKAHHTVGHADNLGDALGRVLANKNNPVKEANIWIVDVVTLLNYYKRQGVPSLDPAIGFATGDKEWLVLPIDPCPSIHGELTAIVDDHCISKCEKYVLV